MRRIRWFDRDSDDPCAPIDWRAIAIVTATLFLNFSFFNEHGLAFAGWGTTAAEISVLAFAAFLMTALFFLGPALAVHATRRGVLELLENSIGQVPAVAVRLCCLLFLVLWIAEMVSIPTLWAMGRLLGGGSGPIKRGAIAVALLSLLFFTSLQGTRTSVKLALFTDKLGIAILLAALIRVRDGWGAVPRGFPVAGLYPHALELTSGLSYLALYAAPLGLLAADFALRIPRREGVRRTVVTGITLPMFVSLALATVVGMATAVSRLYQPSLSATVGMALWAHAADKAIAPRMLIAGITTFGALRFGFRSLTVFGPKNSPRNVRWAFSALAIATIVFLAVDPFATAFTRTLEFCEKALAVAGAILTADAVLGVMTLNKKRRFDPVGLPALVAGTAVAVLLPTWCLWEKNQWWLPWLFPSYAVAALVYVGGRRFRRVPG